MTLGAPDTRENPRGAAAMRPRLAVRRLTMTNFRNYGSARVTVDERPVVLTGANGAGKTNLLEALSFLVPGRGLRRASLGEIARRGGPSEAWSVAATLDGASGPVELGTGIAAAPGETARRRAIRIDGEDAGSQSDLARHVSMNWLTPEMDRLFDSGASGRRRFLDRLVCGFDRDHAARIGRYERAMRERNRLLRRTGPRGDGAWLDALESQMAETGVAVAAARRSLVGRLGAYCTETAGGFPAARIAVEGAVEDMLADAPALAVEDATRARLAESRFPDAEAGRAGFGVHRSDLACTHVARDCPAGLCSTGEQKALLVRIVLAASALNAAERGSAPILLLDEIGAHLDRDRRAALFDAVLRARRPGLDDRDRARDVRRPRRARATLRGRRRRARAARMMRRGTR